MDENCGFCGHIKNKYVSTLQLEGEQKNPSELSRFLGVLHVFSFRGLKLSEVPVTWGCLKMLELPKRDELFHLNQPFLEEVPGPQILRCIQVHSC